MIMRKKIMARKNRKWFQGAIYHIMARGNYRQNIFKDDEDFKVFLLLMQDAKTKYGFKLHAYCLMTNHYHLLLETEQTEIWKIMKRINQIYAAYYNEKYRLTGHLFQGRYKSCLVENDSYFLQTSRYIHLNPVKAKMVPRAEAYPWSSYSTLIGMKQEMIVEVKRTYAYFKEPQNFAYRNFVEDTTLNRYEAEIQKSMGEDDLWLPW